MTHYILTFSTFKNAHNGTQVDAATRQNGPIFNGEDRAQWALTRYTGAGATDAALTELSAEEYRALTRARLPRK